MFCEHPKGNYPCNKCRACKLRKVNEKMIVSIFAAAEYKKKGQFLTLTFNDEFLPDGLDHSIFAGFMKRLRRLDGTPDVKFHVAGEYGQLSGREHFHVLFYNHKYDIELVKRAWRDVQTGRDLGFVYDGTLTPKSIKYVSGYVNKKGYDPGSGKRPPYGRTSCNLPDGLKPEELVKMCSTGKVEYNGRKFSVPQVWRRRYRDIWRYLEEKRDEYNIDDIMRHGYRKVWTPSQVTAIMDSRDRAMSLKRFRKKAHNVYYV